MYMKNQQQIDDLIKIIGAAEDNESVTNQMVAEVLAFLNERAFDGPSSGENPGGGDNIKRQLRELSKKVEEMTRRLDEFIGFTYIEAVIIPASGGEVIVGVKTKNKEWEVQ